MPGEHHAVLQLQPAHIPEQTHVIALKSAVIAHQEQPGHGIVILMIIIEGPDHVLLFLVRCDPAYKKKVHIVLSAIFFHDGLIRFGVIV